MPMIHRGQDIESESIGTHRAAMTRSPIAAKKRINNPQQRERLSMLGFVVETGGWGKRENGPEPDPRRRGTSPEAVAVGVPTDKDEISRKWQRGSAAVGASISPSFTDRRPRLVRFLEDDPCCSTRLALRLSVRFATE